MKFRVLQIDAWADFQECPHCGGAKIENNICKNCENIVNDNEGISWTWNNWFHVADFDESIDGPLNEVNALKYFEKRIIESYFKDYELSDDQYNYVLIKKENAMPIMAIEYGAF